MFKKICAVTSLIISSFSVHANDENINLPFSGTSAPIKIEDAEKKKAELTSQLANSFNPQKIQGEMYGITDSGPKLTTEEKVLSKYKPTMDITVPVGGNEMLPIAIALPNRIKTNFNEVEVIGNFNDGIQFDAEGGYLTVVTANENPIGLFIREYGMPETEVAVTLFPFNIGQAVINLEVAMSSKLKRKARENFLERKREIEIKNSLAQISKENKRQREYEAKYTPILESVAKGEDPRGFVLRDVKPAQVCDPLIGSAISHVKLQMYESSRQTIDIVLVENQSAYPVDFDEQYCMYKEDRFGNMHLDKSVVVVGSYPKSTLMPYEKAEVYILRNKNLETFKSKKRQSLLN